MDWRELYDTKQKGELAKMVVDIQRENEELKENIRTRLIHYTDSIRDYEREANKSIGFDRRDSEEIVDTYLRVK
jgi:hypothetical protein